MRRLVPQVIIGVSIPLMLLLVLIGVVIIWYYKKRYYMYQHLKRLSHRQIQKQEKIGEGHFGEVWKAKLGEHIIVIKTLKESATDRDEKEFREEALLLSKFHNDCIVRPVGICLQSRPIMLGLEYVNGGSLDSYLASDSTRAIITPKDLLLMTKDALKGCLYLESEGYIHRDISARNCLVATVSQQNRKPRGLKLSDFGLAKDIGQDPAYKSRDPSLDVLPVAWTPPEAFSGKFNHKSDVWAFGVLMWEMFSFAATPYGPCSLGNNHTCKLKCSTHDEVEYKVCVEKKSLIDFADPCSAAFCDALKNLFSICWRFDPDDRPSFKQLGNYINAVSGEILKVRFPDFKLNSAMERENPSMGTHDHPNTLFRTAYAESEEPLAAETDRKVPEASPLLISSKLCSAYSGSPPDADAAVLLPSSADKNDIQMVEMSQL